MICLSLTETTLEENEKILTACIKEKTIDLAELRADLLEKFLDDSKEISLQKAQQVCAWAKRQAIPLIFTLRTKNDGGMCLAKREHIRQAVLLYVIQEHAFAYVDVEADIYISQNSLEKNTLLEQAYKLIKNSSVEKPTQIIASRHCFDETWAKDTNWIDKIFNISKQYPQALVKIALMCKTTEQVCKIFEGCKKIFEQEHTHNKFICAAMGDAGKSTRILTAHTHSLWTYTSVITEKENKTSLSHIGHYSPQELHTLYRYKNITPTTPVFAIVGNPVYHSQSPQFHNTNFIEQNVEAVYIHLLIDDCTLLPRLAKLINLYGCSVTMPHKQEVISFLTHIDKSVQSCNACNTIVFEDNNIKGYNTDIEGFLQPLKKRCSVLKNKKISVVGSGGSAKALSYALVEEEAKVLIVNRTIEKAKKLSENINATYTSLDNYKKIQEYSDVIVQTTSVGMNSNEDTPLPDFPFSGKEIVYDIIYTPPETKFLQDAKKCGAQCISGQEMFITQAQAQARIFCERVKSQV